MKRYLALLSLALFTSAFAQNDTCIFDLETQTAEFMERAPQYQRFTWHNRTKLVSLRIRGGDSLYLHRGGCNHFSFWLRKVTKRRTRPASDTAYWISEAQWLVETFMGDADQATFRENIAGHSYEVIEIENGVELMLNNHNYDSWWIRWTQLENRSVVETGYRRT